MRIRIAMMLMLSVFATTSLQGPAYSDNTIREPHSSDQIIVTYKDGTSAVEAVDTERRVSTRSTKALHRDARSRTDVLQVGPGISVESAIATLQNDPNVLYAEPNYVLQKQIVPNDTNYVNGSLWGMYGNMSSPANSFGSQAAEAWAAGYTGSSSVAVGVIDEGIQVTHADLSANIWVNPGETPGDGIDNDRNGFTDDVNGWDFFNNDSTVFDGRSNANIDAHGTHVSGTIGAVGNNGLGVAGVNWNVRIISAKFLGPNGGSTSDAILAIDYLVNLKKNGVNLVAINNSWGGGGFSQAMEDAINRAGDQEIFFVAAAGNGNNVGVGQNNDATANYPSNYDCTKTAQGAVRNWDCVIAVASITSSGSLSTFSNYGFTKVDLGAPGESIISTVPNNAYANYSGTSMATPHVTGAIALCASVYPAITPEQIRSALMSSVIATNSLNGKVASGGRLDIYSLVSSCLNLGTPQTPIAISNSLLIGIAGTPIQLSTTGGSGTIAVNYSTTGPSCSITGTPLTGFDLNASSAASCPVTASNPANGIYVAATSAPVTFNFAAVPQPQLSISNGVLTNTVNTLVTLTTTGGSVGGAVSYATNSPSCSINSTTLTATAAVICEVTATKAANGIYAAATSAPVMFTFTSLAIQSTLSVANNSLSGVAGTAMTLSANGGSGTIAVTYSTTGPPCSITGTLSTGFSINASSAANCAVTASNPANTSYAAATSAPVTFIFTAAPQPQLSISNGLLTNTVNTSVTLTTSGGSVGGAVSYTTNSPSCSINSTTLTATAAANCVVTATKAANGIYAAATSAPVTFTFTAVTVPNPAAPTVVQNSTPVAPAVTVEQLQIQSFTSVPSSIKKNRTIKILAKTNQGNSLSVAASGKCKVTKIYTYKSKKKVLSKFAIKAKSKKGICSVRISAPASSGYSSIDEVKSIIVK